MKDGKGWNDRGKGKKRKENGGWEEKEMREGKEGGCRMGMKGRIIKDGRRCKNGKGRKGREGKERKGNEGEEGIEDSELALVCVSFL